jgi:hypothetical protein
MWFALGLVSLASFFSYLIWRKFFWAWGWRDDAGYLRQDDRPYKTRHSARDEKHTFSFAVTCPPGLYFRIKRETRWDRWAKSIGLSVEQQLGDPDFDVALYLISDDPVWCSELARTDEVRRVVKALFQDRNLRSLNCEGRHLWVDVQLHAKEVPLQYQSGVLVKNMVAALHGIADRLGYLAVQHGSRRRDPFALRAMLLVSLSSAALMLGFVEMLRLFQLEHGDVMLDGTGLFILSILCASALLLFLLILCAARLRGSSYAHVVMWEVLVSGGLGLLMSGYALLRDVNCGWDEAASSVYTPIVVSKSTGYRRKYGTYYKLIFDAHSTQGQYPSTLEVDGTTYHNAVQGEAMAVIVKPGFLGYRWIETVRRP